MLYDLDLVESRAFELIDEAALETAIEGADFKKLVKAMSPRGARSASGVYHTSKRSSER